MERREVQWARGHCIGKGSFGTVCLSVDRSNGHSFAVKSVNLRTAVPSSIQSLENEIHILQSLAHPYIVQYLGNDLTHESPSTWNRNLHMEYLPGGSVAELAAGLELDERVIRSYARCLVEALDYVHSKGIVHCDVKGSNVLVDHINSGIAKLADFGSARRISNDAKVETNELRGTPLWMAPEVVRRENQTPASDLWSLGCTIIEMVTGCPPCGHNNTKESTLEAMFRIGYSGEVPEFPARLSKSGRDFLAKCLRPSASERWTCKQLLRHPFINGAITMKPSPRSVLDAVNLEFNDNDDDEEQEVEFALNSTPNHERIVIGGRERIRELACGNEIVWDSKGWEVVRGLPPSLDGEDRKNNQGSMLELSTSNCREGECGDVSFAGGLSWAMVCSCDCPSLNAGLGCHWGGKKTGFCGCKAVCLMIFQVYTLVLFVAFIFSFLDWYGS